ncbi:MAG: hypothetical protein NTY77_18965 [Elusimicrobia bacterium]|nr:hypothetical protein [Elusimicrobiota bacterium]
MFGILVLALAGCFNSRRVLKLDFNIPEQPQNFSALNTQWDDYNASAPIGWERRNGPGGPLFWSTNRGSQGAQFDIWRADIQVSHVNGYHLGMTDTIFPEDRNKTWDGEAKPMTSANSPGNEFGPVVYCGDAPADPWRPKGYAGADLLEEKGCTLVFASDRPGGKGGLDLYRAQPPGGVPSPITTLNSSGNDSYWTYAGEDHPAAYFASDRGGHGYKIYEICWKDPAKPQPFGGPGAEIRMVPEVAGDGDDTAPYIFWRDGLNMVFASNRSGGQGGFDLWFSHYGKNGWDKPLNLGPRVNSPQDEFRPSVTDKDLLIFSSNRPGGKGGFDLYYAKFISPN